MKAYPAYKDSGVEWLGMVPEGWEVKRLRHIVRLQTEKATTTENPIALENIEGWSGRIIPTDTEFAGDGVAFAAGDILFGKLRPYLAKVAIAETSGEAVGDFHVMRPLSDVLPRFLQLELLTPAVISTIDSSTYGSKMPRVGWDFMADLRFPIPPLSEQQAIAAFLDHETAKIDGLIEEQRRLIALLAEKRQATISHAVTRGLNPSARLKPSGVDWLGDIPEGWEVVRIKTLAEIISKGTTPTTMGFNFEDGGVRFLKAENITLDGRVEPEPEFYISEDADLALSRSRLHARDVLVVIAGATTGKSAILEGDLLPANTNQAVAFIRCRHKDDADWIQRWLSTQSIQNLISLGSVQSAQPNLSMEDLGNLPLLLPPPKESSKILDECGHSISQLDALTETAATAIALLQERRAALISAAVTGKIDVRGLASAEDAA